MIRTNDGHMIDDPMEVVNAQPDFTGMGLEPEKRKKSLKDFIEDIPDWIEFLPEDWTGDSERALITLTMSKAAVNNEEFDFDGYFSTKILLALGKIKRNQNLKKVSLSPKNKISVDISRDIEKVYFYIHVEYAKL